MNSILNEIENDEVALAYNNVLNEWSLSNISGHKAYAVIVSLNKLATTALRSQQTCHSKAQDIFDLAELCCKVESMWKLDQTACMQCVYHIMRYLMAQGEPVLAKNLCEYLLVLRNSIDWSEWNEKESLVLSSCVTFFMCYFHDTKREIVMLPNSDATPFNGWFSFILRVNECNGFKSTSELFKACLLLLKRSQSSCDKTDKTQFLKIAEGLLKEFSNHLKSFVVQNSNWSPKEENILYSFHIISDIIHILNSDDTIEAIVAAIFDFLESIKGFISCYPLKGVKSSDFELIETTLNLCLSSEGTIFASCFEDFCNLTKQVIAPEVYPVIHASLSIFRSRISKLLFKDNKRTKIILNILFDLYMKSKSKGFEQSRTKHSELLHAFTTAMLILSSAKLDSNVLSDLHKNVRLFFREFNSLVSVGQNTKVIFEFGVSYCINIIQSYKDAELYKETASLSKDLIKYMLQISKECLLLESSKGKLDHLFNSFVLSFGKIGLAVEAQIALIAFAGVHPEFTDLIFKYFAELKVNSSDFNLQKDSTSYDIISSEKNLLEEKWPPCVVSSFNIPQILLEEIRAYSKHRELQIGPVIAVYKVALKLVNDKLMLAEILSATVDAVSSDDYTPTLNNLILSIGNILVSLTKLKNQTTEAKKLCDINCAIGNLYYQQLRCDILQIRKKAEEELDLMNNPVKEDVPVLDGKPSNVTPAYSCLKLEQQSAIAEKMFKTLSFWTEAAKLVTEGEVSLFSFRYLKGLAYFFRLYCYKHKEIELWKLIYLISNKLQNAKYKALAVAELLSLIPKVDPVWVKEAEGIVNNDKKLPKKSYISSLFFINLGKNLYLNEKFEESLKVLNGLDENTLKRHFLVNAQHKMVLYLLLKDEPEMLPSRNEGTLWIIVKVFESILYLIKKGRWKTFSEKCVLQWVSLEYSEVISKTYCDLKMIRHARCYAKMHLAAAQRLGLPMRVCKFLTILSETDLLTGKRIEVNEKLRGLDTILGLYHIDISEIDTDSDNLFPVLTTQPDEIIRPRFLSHQHQSCCLLCDNLHLLSIILSAYTLKIIYTSSAGFHDISKHLSSIGKDIVEFSDKKLLRKENHDYTVYNEAKVKFYLGLSFASNACGVKEDAVKYNKAALEILNVRNKLLRHQILFQSAALKRCFISKASVTYKAKLYSLDKSMVENVKTPERASSYEISSLTERLKTVLSSAKFKLPVSPRPTNVRKCIFDEISTEGDLDGKFEINDKENIESPEFKLNTVKIRERSPLAQPLLPSPVLTYRKNNLSESAERTPTGYTDWTLETPKPMGKAKSSAPMRTTRRARTERKTNKSLATELFSTPFPTKTKPPEIKVFCDDDDDTGASRTVKRDRKKPTNTSKKPTTTSKKTKSTITKKNPKSTSKAVSGRKLTFNSDSEEETKSKIVRPFGKVSRNMVQRDLFKEDEYLAEMKQEGAKYNEVEQGDLNHGSVKHEDDKLDEVKQEDAVPEEMKKEGAMYDKVEQGDLNNDNVKQEDDMLGKAKQEDATNDEVEQGDLNHEKVKQGDAKLDEAVLEEDVKQEDEYYDEGHRESKVKSNCWESDDSAIIEPSFVESRRELRLYLPLTPIGPLEESMRKLSLSGKKILPLSTRRMTRLKTANHENTPTSTYQRPTRLTSRLTQNHK